MLQRLLITQFRNLSQLAIQPSPKFNLITGPNGSGKTSILEAIYFLSHGRSFRTQKIIRLIQESQKDFTLFAELSQQNNVYQLGTFRDLDGESKLKINGQTAQSHVPAAKLLPSLLINPELYSQFWQSSSLRRAILDWGLFYQEPDFIHTWQQFSRVLKQRNAQLKQTQYLNIWDESFTQLSEKLDLYRSQYFLKLLDLIKLFLKDFLDTHHIQISYYRGWAKDQDLLTCLQNHTQQDQQLGHTHFGAHRADIKIRIHQGNAQDILSRGQQKRLITSIKLAQGELFETNTQQSCIYLLDDLSSELDQENKQALINKLNQMSSQIFLTSLNPDYFELEGAQQVNL